MSRYEIKVGGDVEDSFETVEEARDRAQSRADGLTRHSGMPSNVMVYDRLQHEIVGVAHATVTTTWSAYALGS